MSMTSRSVSTTRIAARWALITGATVALFAPVAEATTAQPSTTAPRIVRTASSASPEAAMRAAVRRCTPAPKDVRRACWSLYLRPAFRGVPSGETVVSECFRGAREEASEYPGKGVFGAYVRGCVLGNIKNP